METIARPKLGIRESDLLFACSCKGWHIFSMKMCRFGLVAMVMSVSAQSADIVLQDGRVLKDATVKSQTPKTVIIRHAAGLTSVAKTILSPDLQFRYPVDEVAAVAAERRAAEAREAVRKNQKAEAERMTNLQVPAAPDPLPNVDARPSDAENAKKGAQLLAQNYFEKEYSKSGDPDETRNCTVKILEIRSVEGWSGRWFVTGTAFVERFRGEKVVLPNRENMSAKEIRRAVERATNMGWENRKFDGYYSTGGSAPTIDISLR